ncbi:hypothetical protein L0668_05550 [Paraglaciecola aquimarina]|uniref:Uncharacterized protein n=1 Tax=Paraglaciecola algarum TaxID=3050085 RepID=A0ABS9D3R7_9ALTE|nr:hypothetical protein [Paraglaciecola sp. G1-23]MCF2947564.1 hypothetical protein [Paraglaciecola sp. G1-23]
MNISLKSMLALLIISSSADILAKPNFIYLDATKKKWKAIRAYQDAIQDYSGAKLSLRVYLKVDARKGFDAGYLRLDPSVKKADIQITIRIVGGHRMRKPIVVNAIELGDSYALYSINQQINIF